MVDTFTRLIIDTGGDPNFDVNIPDNIVPDAGRNQVYTFRQSYQSTSQYIWTHDLTTGLFVEKNLPTFPDSGNNRFQAGTAVLVGGYLYVVSYQVANQIPTLHLSKLDPATMAEVDSVALAAAGYVFALVDFKTCAFTLGGTNYVAVALSAATGAPIEVFDVDAMTSEDVFDYPDEGGDCWLVAGHQPSGTTQKLYIIADGFPAGDEPPFISLTFDSATGITGSTVDTISAPDIDAGWLAVSEIGAHPIDISALMFDASDNNIIFAAWNQDWATQGGTPGYIVKLNSTTGAVVWVVPVPDIPYYFDQSARLNDLSEATLVYVPSDDVTWPSAPYGAIPADQGVYYTINTTTGAYTTALSTHFDRATEQAQLWDSVNGKLFFFSGGPESDWQDDGTFAETIGDPWYEGWAIFGTEIEGGGGEEPGEDECGAEDEADAAGPCDVDWPACVLVPSRINVDVFAPSVSPGRSFNGFEQLIQPDAGHWRIMFHDIPVRTKAEALEWRRIESALRGRNGTICVPIYQGKLSATPIVATSVNAYPIGATRMVIHQTAGDDIGEGFHFSAGEWLYRVTRLSDESSGVKTVAIVPPLREAIAEDEALDFNDPRCRCRLERDDSMDINLELLRFGTASVGFVEDV